MATVDGQQLKREFTLEEVQAAVAKIDSARLPVGMHVTAVQPDLGRCLVEVRIQGAGVTYRALPGFDVDSVEVYVFKALQYALAKAGDDAAYAALRMMRGDQRTDPWTIPPDEKAKLRAKP